jgi:4-nitrophenyl phosphatase
MLEVSPSDVNSAGVRNWKLALIDLDGTLYRGSQAIEGAGAFVRRLRQRGIQPVFFTNNSTRTPAQVKSKLASMDISAYEDEVCTSAQASATYLQQRVGTGEMVLYIGEQGLKDALQACGFHPLLVRTCSFAESGQASAAVLGLDPQVTYRDLTTFCERVADLQSFILTNGDVRLPAEGKFLPGNGALGSFVSTATGIQPYVAGKPNADFVKYALDRFHVSPNQALLIGDNIDTDIAAGHHAGVYSILVETGVQNAPSLQRPFRADEVVPSVADLFHGS